MCIINEYVSFFKVISHANMIIGFKLFVLMEDGPNCGPKFELIAFFNL